MLSTVLRIAGLVSALAFALECQALQLVAGGFDTQAVAIGNIGPGNPSIFEPTLTSYQLSACASCSGPFFPYPIVNANAVAQYGPGLSTATGQGNDLTFGQRLARRRLQFPGMKGQPDADMSRGECASWPITPSPLNA